MLNPHAMIKEVAVVDISVALRGTFSILIGTSDHSFNRTFTHFSKSPFLGKLPGYLRGEVPGYLEGNLAQALLLSSVLGDMTGQGGNSRFEPWPAALVVGKRPP